MVAGGEEGEGQRVGGGEESDCQKKDGNQKINVAGERKSRRQQLRHRHHPPTSWTCDSRTVYPRYVGEEVRAPVRASIIQLCAPGLDAPFSFGGCLHLAHHQRPNALHLLLWLLLLLWFKFLTRLLSLLSRGVPLLGRRLLMRALRRGRDIVDLFVVDVCEGSHGCQPTLPRRCFCL